MDEDFLKSDDDLGAAMAGLGDLADGRPHTLTLTLRGPNATGSVTLQAQFLPFASKLLTSVIRCISSDQMHFMLTVMFPPFAIKLPNGVNPVHSWLSNSY